jgi:hypothetical protein
MTHKAQSGIILAYINQGRCSSGDSADVQQQVAQWYSNNGKELSAVCCFKIQRNTKYLQEDTHFQKLLKTRK